MTQYYFLESITLPAAWLTVGIFDGVHRGHQKVLGQLVSGARAAGLPAVVLTFAPHPAVVLGGKTDFKNLTTSAERAELLESFGVDIVITQTFDRRLADQTAEAFMQEVVKTLGLRCLVAGYDTALGRGREGTTARLAEIGKQLGYRVEVVPPLTDASGVLSSTRIRTAIAAGNMAAATSDLGRYYYLSGPVVHGDGRGHTINIPTANIQVPDEKLLPANGIYACWAWVEGKRYPAATNVGIRPTFTPELSVPKVEAHLPGFDRNLYGQVLKLEFVEYLRPEEKYSTIPALLDQIKLDIANTIERLREKEI